MKRGLDGELVLEFDPQSVDRTLLGFIDLAMLRLASVLGSRRAPVVVIARMPGAARRPASRRAPYADRPQRCGSNPSPAGPTAGWQLSDHLSMDRRPVVLQHVLLLIPVR
jgi:hypothetical protein